MDGHLPPPKVGAGAGDSAASVHGCSSSLIWSGHTDKLQKIWFEMAAGFFSFLFSSVDLKCAMCFENPVEHQKLPTEHT